MIEHYRWLSELKAPKMLIEGVKLYGTYEYEGDLNNPQIITWANEVGIFDYKHDATPWCGLFMALCAKRAGWSVPSRPLWALNWQSWERSVTQPMLGDVMVFKRAGGGHVAMYVGEDETHWHILGGNQMDRVSIVRRAKAGWWKARRPHWRIAQPKEVRPVRLSSTGILAGRED